MEPTNNHSKIIDTLLIYKTIADALEISVTQINNELHYQCITQWDSMGHINLMLALEKKFEIKINQDQVLELTSVNQIVSFVLCGHAASHIENSRTEAKPANVSLHRGLNNVYFDESNIAFIDVANNKLFYRGYSIDDLTAKASYEEVAHLLIYGELPNHKALSAFIKKIQSFREISEDVIKIIKILIHTQSAVSVLRTIASAISETLVHLPIEEQGIAYLAKIPTIIGTYFAFKNNTILPHPSENLSQAAYFFFMLFGEVPDKSIVRIFEQNMILQAEHDSNASTFSARITNSSETELGNSITSAISTFSGNLHGGALLGVVEMLEEIQDVSKVKEYIKNRLQKKLPVYGFGHRVYRLEDPRAMPLKENARVLSANTGNNKLLEILEAVKVEMTTYIEHGVNINVDFYACISYLLMDLQKNMLVPIFIASRCAGWVAHIIEQKNNNILIRPRLHYVGKVDKKFVDINQRE